jgi:CheY-like chemotaxis protein
VSTSKILVIDDSRVIRKTVRDMLPEGDFEVIEAKDGVEGIEKVEEEHPTLIMLDFILPKMSGWDVFQRIQAHPEFQKIPLVLMSGRKEEVTNKIAEPFEYFEFIEKPFDKIILADAIRLAMTKARKARPRNPADISGSIHPVTNELSSIGNDEIAQLQARITQLQTSTSAEIQALQTQLAEVDRSRQTEIQALTTKFEIFQQSKELEHQAELDKVIELETEVNTLKKQLGQLVVLIKKKLT